MVQQKCFRLGTMRLRVRSLDPHSVGQGSGIAVSCGVGCRCVSDPALLCLWHRWAATALIRPLAWETPYATGEALKKKKTNKKKTKKKKKGRKKRTNRVVKNVENWNPCALLVGM